MRCCGYKQDVTIGHYVSSIKMYTRIKLSDVFSDF